MGAVAAGSAAGAEHISQTASSGESPGSRVVAFVTFPRPAASVDALTFARRLQLRGQPRFHTAFQFNPFREPYASAHHTDSPQHVNRTPAHGAAWTSGAVVCSATSSCRVPVR